MGDTFVISDYDSIGQYFAERANSGVIFTHTPHDIGLFISHEDMDKLIEWYQGGDTGE